MPHFTDSTGRVWTLAVTIGAARHIKNAGIVDLLNPDANDPPLAQRLLNTETVIDLIWLLTADQIEKAGMSQDDFLRALDGPAALAAETALREALTDFFRDRRDDLVRALEKAGELVAAEVAANRALIDDPEAQAELDAHLAGKRKTLLATLRQTAAPTAGT
ncbi:MAG: hypothetical protein GX547_16235 [Phycisphaerae bacterium]|nr:hypothetical protein [Phycisphaerae bacterium]